MRRKSEEQAHRSSGSHRSKLNLALGAAGLFLFIVGVKRTFRHEEPAEVEGGGAARGDGAPDEKPAA